YKYLSPSSLFLNSLTTCLTPCASSRLQTRIASFVSTTARLSTPIRAIILLLLLWTMFLEDFMSCVVSDWMTFLSSSFGQSSYPAFQLPTSLQPNEPETTNTSCEGSIME